MTIAPMRRASSVTRAFKLSSLAHKLGAQRGLAGPGQAVQAEAIERLAAAAQLTAPAHTDRATRLQAEAAVLLRLLDDEKGALQE